MGDILTTLFDRRYRRGRLDGRPLDALCDELMSSTGEVSGAALARAILDGFAELDDEGKRGFFRYLNDGLDLDPEAVGGALAAYRETPSRSSLRRFLEAAEPARQELARRLNQVPGATGRIVSMRADLLRLARDEPELARADLDLRHLLSSWFNRGFLVLRPISWDSPAQVLEKIIAYEAVHAIASWDDLRRRVQPEDRRCFGFFHPAMPDEPLIFVEVALTRGIPGSVQDLLAEERETLQPEEADTAVFYSISNCQAGLAGISFGNFLIKQVAEDLSRSLPQLRTFVTLSPIPGLAAWAASAGLTLPQEPEPLRRMAAHYLLEAKDSRGRPADPVARFHLNNGALVHLVHAGADTSPNGLAQSGGAMVNYLYDLDRVAANHEAFAAGQKIIAAPKVQALAKDFRQGQDHR